MMKGYSSSRLFDHSAESMEGLKHWLVCEGMSTDQVSLAVGHISDFYCCQILPTFHCPVKVGVSAKKSEHGGINVWLSLLWPTPLSIFSPEQSREMNDLSKAFTEQVAVPLLPDLSVYLDFVPPNDLIAASFEARLRQFCHEEAADCLGILEGSRSPVSVR